VPISLAFGGLIPWERVHLLVMQANISNHITVECVFCSAVRSDSGRRALGNGTDGSLHDGLAGSGEVSRWSRC